MLPLAIPSEAVCIVYNTVTQVNRNLVTGDIFAQETLLLSMIVPQILQKKF